MGYKCSFMDNQIYSAQDINERFSMMFTSGVSLGESGNVLADLNGITEEIVTSGVLPDACRIEKTDSGYKISAGTAIMEDGSAISFDAEGYEFSAESGVYSYVYLVRNEPQNTIDIVVSQVLPEGEYVPLGEITQDGNVLDRRKYANLKINSYQSDTLRNFEKSFSYADSYAGETYDLENGNFSYVIIWSGKYYSTGNTRVVYSSDRDILPIEDGQELKIIMVDDSGYTRFVFWAKKNGQLLETRIDPANSRADYEISFGII